MRTLLFAPYRPVETPGPVDRCLIFAWLGQSFNTCDDCGQPVSEHLYHPPYGRLRPLFHVKQRDYHGRWVWRPVGALVKAGVS